MKIDAGDSIIVNGFIRDISFTPTNDNVSISFTDSDIVFEFRNGKRKRADMIRKMRLHKGEKIMAIGAKSKASPLCVFGWDVKRKGIVKNKNYLMVQGKVIQNDGFTVQIDNGKKSIRIECPMPIANKSATLSCIKVNERLIAFDVA